MSEYQYYEFQTIDRRLTEQERAEVGKISSRTHPGPTKAVFVYNYSDFRGRPEKVLEKYFDAMYYLANFGCLQVMFRFPHGVVDAAQIDPYCLEDHISFYQAGGYDILNLNFSEEESFGYWVEGEGTLSTLIPLRSDIMRQDYRALYLAWLKATTLAWDLDETTPEPPVPLGLQALTPALQDFVDLIAIDEHLYQAAIQTSASRKAGRDKIRIRAAIPDLPLEEAQDFLVRLIQDEPGLSARLRHRLRSLAGIAAPEAKSSRTIGELWAAAKTAQKAAQQKQAEAARKAHLRRMKEIAQQEPLLWKQVYAHIREKKTSAYEEAVVTLKKLRDLAEHENRASAFFQRVNEIHRENKRLVGLRRRLDRAGLQER